MMWPESDGWPSARRCRQRARAAEVVEQVVTVKPVLTHISWIDAVPCQAARMTRLRSRSKLARPYIWRLIILIRLTLPSTAPELWGRVRPLSTAAWFLSEPGGEGAQVGLVIDLGGGDPGVEAVAVAAGEDLGELGDVACEGIQVGAAGPHVFELDLLVFVQGGGVAQDPARHVPGRGRAQGPEGLQVVPHDAVTAGVAGRLDLGVQLQHVGAPGVPPLVQVGLELIQDRWPPAAGLAQQLLHAAGAGEPAHRFFGQPEFPTSSPSLSGCFAAGSGTQRFRCPGGVALLADRYVLL